MKSRHSHGARSGKYQPIGKANGSSSYIPPYEMTETCSSSHSSYQPPTLISPGFDVHIPKRVERNAPTEFSRKEIRVPFLQDDEVETRFQEELEELQRCMRRKKRPAKRIPADIAKDMEGMVVTEDERVDTDLSMFTTGDDSIRTSPLQQENQRLHFELRQTSKILKQEREQKEVLRGEIEKLENQVERIRADKKSEFNSSYQAAVRELQGQMLEYRERLAEEQVKGQMLQLQVESLRKENLKCRERMKVMMFQHIPSISAKLQDIGPCKSQLHESPNRVADYELGAQLGEGHYGKVAVGTNVATGDQFAVKVLDKTRIARFKDLQQVGMEVHVLKNFAHPNIVHLQEVIHAPENLYIVTELCLMDLHKHHNDVGLSEYGAQQVIFGILKPLNHLHSQGICHLDLKPENILLAAHVDVNNISHYDVRLCDFGLVNMAKNPEADKSVVRRGYACGTPGFFAPEMILDNSFEGRQADMWSLGCIILELTLGFTQEWIDSYEQIEKDSDAFRRGLEACLEDIAPIHYPRHGKLLDIIHRCLSIDPLLRIKASEGLIHPWLEDILNSDEGREEQIFPFGGLTSKTKHIAQMYEERSELGSSMMMC